MDEKYLERIKKEYGGKVMVAFKKSKYWNFQDYKQEQMDLRKEKNKMKSLPSFQIADLFTDNKIKINQWGYKYLEPGEITIRYGSKEHIAIGELEEQNSLLKQEIKRLEGINDCLAEFIMKQSKIIKGYRK